MPKRQKIVLKIDKKLKIPDGNGKPDFYQHDDWLFEWCCDCGLRHIKHFEIIRGNKPENDGVLIRSIRDGWSTDARKKLRKLGVKT